MWQQVHHALVVADGGYAGRFVHWAADKTHIALEIIRRGDTDGFEVLPQRWVVNRTLAWSVTMSSSPLSPKPFITIAASATMLRRWI